MKTNNTNNANNANNINVKIPENVKPVKVDAPKVTAKRGISVKSAVVANNPAISFETLLALDVVERNGDGNYNITDATNNAREYLKAANSALESKITDSATAVLLASIGKNTEQAAKAGRRAATAMALFDMNGAYKSYGYKSAAAMFSALYPNLADSTIWNYINVGKEIYIPAKASKAPLYLKELATLEPGTALSAVGALRDENARKLLPAALEKAKKDKNSKKLTQSIVKAASKAARNPEKTDTKKEDGTKGTDAKDEKAKADVVLMENKAAYAAGLQVCIQKGIYIPETQEQPFTIDDANKNELKTLFDNAIKEGNSALLLEVLRDYLTR